MKKSEIKQPELTNEQKRMMSAIYRFLPVFADFMQDLEEIGFFTPEIRQKHTKNLIYKIRKFDQFLISVNENHSDAEQIDAQIQFRQILKELLPFDEQPKEHTV